ncbi:hypothetical protein BLNAU_7190 [Blattamonas nauphoetae]|uniref:Uncharacterized protein n=1 Tax=Blattamonas nauphoetae TaxID=2049346 RepID=A0ABQ9Y200_9EUKA|nr:hypothetical protein BLNAU_7190 [Blattamonas nauphoetae]
MNTLQEPFLTFDVNSDLSFEDKSTIYRSLVALVKAKYPFDIELQDRCVQFLKSLEPKWSYDKELANKLVTDLVPSSAGSSSGFVPSIAIVLSLPHSIVVEAALSFLSRTTQVSSAEIQNRLVESDLITKVFAIVQPQTLSISGNEEIFDYLINIIFYCLDLASPSSLIDLGITIAADKYNRREMIFQKVVLPSSKFVTFLITNRHILNEDLLHSFMSQLDRFIDIGPFHRPTLEFVVASPIVMPFSSCFSFVEDDQALWNILNHINLSLGEWKKHGHEVVQSAKRMMQALISEGFEDTLEQTLMLKKSGYYGFRLVDECHSISEFLGSNMPRR